MDGEFDEGQSGTSRRRESDRARQREVLGPLDITRHKFEHARFVAAQIGFKQGKTGDIHLEIVIPYEYRGQALDMLDASGIPLSFDVVPWRRNQEHWERPDESAEEAG